ncbi:hypothetical protein [Desulfurobacterium crinifex]
MEKFEVFLFLLGIVSIAIIVLAFFVPLFLLGIYRNVKETRKLIEELLKEVRRVSGSDEAKGNEISILDEDHNSAKLHEIFLSLDAAGSTVTDDRTEEEKT